MITAVTVWIKLVLDIAWAWIKLVLDIAWAWISLSVIRAFYQPPSSYWVIINRVMQVRRLFVLVCRKALKQAFYQKAMFASGMILFVEKLSLQFVAINFHKKALADRLAENQLGLKALDRLSNAPVLHPRKPVQPRRGHRNPGSSNSIDVLGVLNRSQNDYYEGSSASPDKKGFPNDNKMRMKARSADVHSRKKTMASVIVDQVGGAIGQFALKNSKFNQGRVGGLSSARRLARKLFSTLSDSPRSRLTVEGAEMSRTC